MNDKKIPSDNYDTAEEFKRLARNYNIFRQLPNAGWSQQAIKSSGFQLNIILHYHT